MNLSEYNKLPTEMKRKVAKKCYSEALKAVQGPRKKCHACGDEFPESCFFSINDNGDKVCERCIFILALYIQNGIRKKVSSGNLHPEKLNAQFRKIVEEEFYIDPKKAYKTYLGEIIKKEEEDRRIIWITGKEFHRIKNDFPFFLMTEEEVSTYHPAESVEITLRTEDPLNGEEDTLKRRIYMMHKITAKAAKKYSGNAKRRFVCFVPPEEYYAK